LLTTVSENVYIVLRDLSLGVVVEELQDFAALSADARHLVLDPPVHRRPGRHREPVPFGLVAVVDGEMLV
jgi:hypothetical protein